MIYVVHGRGGEQSSAQFEGGGGWLITPSLMGLLGLNSISQLGGNFKHSIIAYNALAIFMEHLYKLLPLIVIANSDRPR